MTTTEKLELIQQRTKMADQAKILRELRAANRWVMRRVYNSAGGADLVSTVGEELTALVTTTRDYDLGAAVAGRFLGIRELWVKLPTETRFTRMYENENLAADNATVADPDIAYGHPITFAVLNFQKLRFVPALPTGAIIRVDYAKITVPPDPSTNPTADAGTDITELFDDAEVSKACAQLFTTLDDDRVGTYETRARDELNDALLVALKRTKKLTRTRPFRGR